MLFHEFKTFRVTVDVLLLKKCVEQSLLEMVASSISNALPGEYYMKNMFLLAGICCLFSTVIVKADDSFEITYEPILKYGNHGGYDVDILEVLQDTAALNSYLTGTGYDPSVHSPFEIPDLTAETLIALITEYGGGSIHYRRTVERISESTTVITVETVCDTLLHDVSISVQQGYNVLLIAVPRTDKNIILHERDERVSIKPAYKLQTVNSITATENKQYTLQGRLVRGSINMHGTIVGSVKNGRVVTVFTKK